MFHNDLIILQLFENVESVCSQRLNRPESTSRQHRVNRDQYTHAIPSTHIELLLANSNISKEVYAMWSKITRAIVAALLVGTIAGAATAPLAPPGTRSVSSFSTSR